MVVTETREIRTTGQGDVRDLTAVVADVIAASRVSEGLATVFVVGSTAGVTTIEFEPGAVDDFDRMLETLAPRDADYRHHLRWGDDNGSSHVRAALLGPSVSIPFRDGKLLLGTWQQVVLVECDTRGRSRRLVIQLLGG